MSNHHRVLRICFLLLFAMTGCTTTKQKNLNDIAWNLHLYTILNPTTHTDFSINPIESSLIQGPEPETIWANWITYEINIPKLTPGRYCVYCPNIGDPFAPEYSTGFFINPEGTMYPLLHDGTYSSTPSQHIRTICPRISGFCSDWYLIPLDPPFEYQYAASVYQPICVTDACGHSLTIHKKEIGGNVVDVQLKGFSPDEEVMITLETEETPYSWKKKISQDGSLRYICMELTIQKKKDVLKISASTDHVELQTTYARDPSTLSIKRDQPHTLWHKAFINSKPIR